MSSRAVSLAGRRRQATWPLRGPRGIFTKSLRDSRRAILLAGIGLGLTVVAVGMSTAANYPTLASRQQQLVSVQAAPGFGSLFGVPIGIETLGGLVSWRDGMMMALLLGLWSILSLSGTLAGEMRAGSFEVLAGAPLSRRRIACEKLAAHLASLALAVVVMAAMAWLTGIVYAVLPGDSMAFTDALAHFAGLALVGLVGGSMAFALAPFLGRALAAGVAAAALFGAFFVYAYREVVPAFGAIQGLSWFRWTAYQQPLAGSWDLASLMPVGALAVAFLALGVMAFERRDAGCAAPLPRLALPGRRFLLGGPARQVFLGSRTAALAWGIGLGLATGAIAVGAPSLAASATSDPGSERFVRQVFGDTDWTSTRGLLQLAFAWFGYLIMALVAATLVHGLASDERERRLEMVLATPVSRPRWLVAGGLGVFASLGLMTLVVALFTTAGAAAGGQDAVGPFAGVWVGGLYAAALAGLGLAALGLGAVELAPAVPAGLGIGLYFFDAVGSALRLPPEVTALSLTHHLGRPMAGVYDWPGMTLLAVLAVGGLVVGAWGVSRRDLSR
jgi:ABC-2 type transport system permease protein